MVEPLGRRERKSLLGRIYHGAAVPWRLLKGLQRPQHVVAAVTALGRRDWTRALEALEAWALRRLAPMEARHAAAAAAPWHQALQQLGAMSLRQLEASEVTRGLQMRLPSWCHVLQSLSETSWLAMAPSVRHHNELLKHLNWHLALDALHTMHEVSEYTSSLLMEKLKGRWPLALQLFFRLEAQRLEHDTVNLNALLAATNRRSSEDLLDAGPFLA